MQEQEYMEAPRGVSHNESTHRSTRGDDQGCDTQRPVSQTFESTLCCRGGLRPCM